MHFTLHLTNRCNMDCDYCYVGRSGTKAMSLDTAKLTVDFAARIGDSSIGINFSGGEPLLERDLIVKTIEYCQIAGRQHSFFFHYKITTNGLLLDDSLLKYAKDNGILIAMSHDGVREAHDRHRRTSDGEPSFDVLSEKAGLLLSYQPYAPVLITVSPDTAENYAESVSYLYNLGFRYIICSLDYSGKWDDLSIGILRDQYGRLADFYLEKTLDEGKFYLSPFEAKINSRINRSAGLREKCELGRKQISVSPDGIFYPCVQFVGDDKYAVGNAANGLDKSARDLIYEENEREKPECAGCTLTECCNHYCGCANFKATGSIGSVSPVFCAHEKILLPVADLLAEKLYNRRSALFMHRRDNDKHSPAASAKGDSSRNFRVYKGSDSED